MWFPYVRVDLDGAITEVQRVLHKDSLHSEGTMSLRTLLLIATLFATSACSGGDDDSADAAQDAATDDATDGTVIDANTQLDADEPDVDEEPTDASQVPDANPDCVDGGAGDAGTQTVQAMCTRLCGTYLMTCASVPTGCQNDCETSNGSLPTSTLARMYDCLDISGEAECAGVPACLTDAVSCP